IAYPGDLDAAHLRLGFGKKLALHFARDFELRLQTLLLLSDNDEPAQMLGHGVEGRSQLGQLILAGHRNAMCEVAFFDALCSLVEFVHRAGYAAAELDTRQ